MNNILSALTHLVEEGRRGEIVKHVLLVYARKFQIIHCHYDI